MAEEEIVTGGCPMSTKVAGKLVAFVVLGAVGLTAAVQAQQATMSFFVTSVGKGDGGNLGGLEGADAHCQALAKAAGSTKTSWKAYLSTTATKGESGCKCARPYRQGTVAEC